MNLIMDPISIIVKGNELKSSLYPEQRESQVSRVATENRSTDPHPYSTKEK